MQSVESIHGTCDDSVVKFVLYHGPPKPQSNENRALYRIAQLKVQPSPQD